MQDLATALKFVKGAVGAKDFVAEMSHFKIKDGKISAFNGRMSLCHPIDLSMDVYPKARFFERALAALPPETDGPMSITVTQTGRLSIKAGAFKAQVHCHMDVPEGFFPQPEGEVHEINLGLLDIFKDVYPFTAEDASRPWAQAVRLEGNSAFATNNTVLVERWCTATFPSPIVITKECVKEMLRIGIEPCGLQIGQSSATFHYPNGAWLRTQFMNDEWPPNFREIIDQPRGGLMEVPPDFHENMKRLEHFIEDSGIIQIRGNLMSTTSVDSEGASIETPLPLGDSSFHIAVLVKISSIATKIDCRHTPMVFVAPRMRGVAMPMRTATP